MNQGFEDDGDEEDEVAVQKLHYWHLTAHVHGKAINISCGDATQRLKWLAHVAIGKVHENVLLVLIIYVFPYIDILC